MIRIFGRESPPRKIILRAIDVTRWAPNHRLTAPWRFYLLGPATADAICRLNARLTSQAKDAQAGQVRAESAYRASIAKRGSLATAWTW